MSDLPWIVKEFLLKLTVNPDCYTFVVMTSNNGKSGNSFVSLSQALSRSGANLSAVFDLQMPGNCLISSFHENLELLKKVGNDHVDVTIGSALDLFGGNMKFEDVLEMCRR